MAGSRLLDLGLERACSWNCFVSHPSFAPPSLALSPPVCPSFVRQCPARCLTAAIINHSVSTPACGAGVESCACECESKGSVRCCGCRKRPPSGYGRRGGVPSATQKGQAGHEVTAACVRACRFVLLALQFGRNQMVNLGARPYTAWVKAYR